MQPNNANEHNVVKSPGWKEADQLAICNRSGGDEKASTEKQLQLSGQNGT